MGPLCAKTRNAAGHHQALLLRALAPSSRSERKTFITWRVQSINNLAAGLSARFLTVTMLDLASRFQCPQRPPFTPEQSETYICHDLPRSKTLRSND